MPLAKVIARADLEIASFSVIGSGGMKIAPASSDHFESK
jgi:hypothetical protein